MTLNVFALPFSQSENSITEIINDFLCLFVCAEALTSQSIIFQLCRDGATASWVIDQYFLGVECVAQGYNMAAVGFEPLTSRY